MEHPVEAALGTDVKAPIRQHRHYLTWLQRREFRLVAGEEDPLAFFFAEAVRHMAAAALTPVHTAAVTSELPAPTLQRCEPYPQQTSVCSGSCTSSPPRFQGSPRICGDRLLWSVPRVLSPVSLDLFEAISNAAVSASALSLRRSSCCSRLISR